MPFLGTTENQVGMSNSSLIAVVLRKKRHRHRMCAQPMKQNAIPESLKRTSACFTEGNFEMR